MPNFCMGCMAQYDQDFNICPNCGYIEDTKIQEALHMEPGSILRDRYIVGKALGFGGFGVTYIGWDAVLEQKIAIKEYLPSEFSTRVPGQTQITVFSGDKSEQFGDGLSKFIDEAQRLAKFHQEDGVVRIFDSFEANNTAYIIMELLQGETLADYLKRTPRMSANDAISLLMPVIYSLQAINERGIIHRDIAPDNIFLTDDGKVKLIDFGAARFATTSHSRSLTVIIKPGYSPEEQYRSRGDQGSHTDVYAIGATLYRMVTGEAPPDAMERRAHFEGKQKDILNPIAKFTRDITENQETAILNALNVRIEDRTQNMATLAKELTTVEPEKVKRLYGKIKKIDILKWPLWAKIGAPAAMLSVIVLSTLFLLGIIGFDAGLQTLITIPDGQSRVPSVISDSMDQASTRLTVATLLYSIIGRDYDERVPANLVLTQHISGGQVVEINTIVEITISGGAETETVPDVSGLSLEDAQVLLEELGFAVLILHEYNDVFAAGAIISQDIEPDSNLAFGSTITIIVSQGINPYEAGEQWLSTIPALVGLELDDALDAAQQAGFVVSIRSRGYSYEFDRDIVMFQDLEPGTELLSGNTIELIVSLGVQIIRVPDVQFRTEAEAVQHIANAGLIADITHVYSETVASGLVISQSPAADTVMEPGDTVAIVVSAGGESFAMPNVVGMTEAVANSTITGRGLSVSVDFERNDNVPEGNVIRQSIASGASVNRGTRVTITVSSGQNLVQVANVVGRPQTEAGNTLRGQGFTVVVNETASETVAQGNVISQSLTAGSSQISGAQIIITVSTGMPIVDVPNIVGRTQSAAETALRNAGFTVSTTSAASATVPSGSVISQTPAGGTATTGSTVALVISTGPEDVRVANVVGQARAAAETTIRGQGLTVTVVEVFNETVARGNVISQTPAAGTTVSPGSAVTINVSRGTDTVTSIAIRNTPSRTIYNVGDTLNTAGLSLNVTWASGDTTIATSGFTVSPTVLNTQGTQTVTVTFSGRTTTFEVTVQDSVNRISIQNNPTRTTYVVGETLDTAGLSLNVHWASGRTTTVNNGFTVSPTTLTVAGTRPITVTYQGRTVTFNVTVNVAHIPVTSVTGVPTTATTGTPLALTGPVSPANAINRTLSCSVANADTTGATISGNTLNATAAGTVAITATVVNGEAPGVNFTQNFTVTVTAAHIPVRDITDVPTTATAGTPLPLAGTVNPANATNRAITWSVANADTAGATISGNTLNTTAAGNVTVRATVVGGGATAGTNYYQNFTVTVQADVVTNIEVRTPPTRTTYVVGDRLDLDGLTVVVTWSSGRSLVFIDDVTDLPGSVAFTVSPMTLNTQGTQTITLSKGGRSATFNVTVAAAQGSIPNVVGQTRANAERTIRDAGFVVGTITEEHHATVAAGNVMSQSPAANSTQNLGTAVNIIVSRGPVPVAFTVTASYTEQPPLLGQIRRNINATTSIDATSVTVTSQVGNTTYGPFNMHSQNSRQWTFAATFFTVGIHTVTITARTADGNTASTTLTITITAAIITGNAPSITSFTSLRGDFDQDYRTLLRATGSTPITWSISDGNLPNGLVLDTNAGYISGIPRAAGDFAFTVRAQNAYGYTTRQFNMFISTILTPFPLPTGRVGVPYSVTLQVGGANAHSFYIGRSGVLGQLPDGLTLNQSTGVISGTPTVAGTFRFIVYVQLDGRIADYTRTIVIEP